MKNKLTLFSFFIFLLNTNIFCQHYLKIIGTVDNRATSKGLKKAKILVLDGKSIPIIKTFTNDSGAYSFKLPLDKADIYFVKVSYPKFVQKIYTISTLYLTKKALERAFPVVEASLSLYKPVPNVDYTLYNEPLNRYYYDTLKDNYAYDKAYLENRIAKVGELKVIEEQAEKDNALKKVLTKKKK